MQWDRATRFDWHGFGTYTYKGWRIIRLGFLLLVETEDGWEFFRR